MADAVPTGTWEPTGNTRLDAVVARIDDANASDPTVIVFRGAAVPKEPLHAQLMTDWLLRLDPDSDERSLIAARGHHVRRWTRPRSEQSAGRAGYLRWRTAAKRFHAETVGSFMREVGYDEADVERVAQLIRKDGLGSDPAVQTHEDALCLVFLDTQLDQTADKLGDDEMVAVLAKTLPKMSPRGVAATGTLDLGDRGADLLQRAVTMAGAGPDR